MQSVFYTPDIWDKLKYIGPEVEGLMHKSSNSNKSKINLSGIHSPDNLTIPSLPSRDAEILDIKLHPNKKGLATSEGQARMLHDLASIELQAMELGLRTLYDFPDAPAGFREELMQITLSEGEHLRICLEGIQDLGFKWGNWPVHCGLWTAVSDSDSLLDRILIVHRYLEGSGLDAGDTLLKRLNGVDNRVSKKILTQITVEEISHVDFGSKWYHQVCENEKLDADLDFKNRMLKLRKILPKRIEPINTSLRKKAGFTDNEIQTCIEIRNSFLASPSQ